MCTTLLVSEVLVSIYGLKLAHSRFFNLTLLLGTEIYSIRKVNMQTSSMIQLSIPWLSIALILLVFFLYVRFFKWLRRNERARRSRISSDVDFSASAPTHEFFPGISKAKQKAQNSLRLRFSIVRTTGLLIAVSAVAGVLLFPFRAALPTQFISLLLAGATVAIGIVTRPFVENLISGVVITFSGQLRTGDTVLINDMYGTVENISPTHTTIKIWDWRRFIIPNSVMMTKEFINYSVVDQFIWAHAEFWVAPDSDLDLVEKLAKQAAEESSYRITSESVDFWIMGMDKDTVKCWIAGWTDDPGQAWNFKADVLKRTLKKLHTAGIQTQRMSVQLADNTTTQSPL